MEVTHLDEGLDVALDFGELLGLEVPAGTIPPGLTVWQMLVTVAVKAGGGFDAASYPPAGLEFGQSADGELQVTFQFRETAEVPPPA